MNGFAKIALIYCCVFSIVLMKAQGQDSNIRELEAKLQDPISDSERISIHLELFTANLHRNPEASFSNLVTAKQLSVIVRNDSLNFDIYTGFVNYYFIKQDFRLVSAYIDSTLVYKNSVSPKKQLSLLTRLAQSSFFLNDFNESIEANKMALAISKSEGLLTQQIGILNQMSSVYRKQGDLINAEKSILQAIELNKNRTIGELMYSKALLGQIRVEQGKEDEALLILEEVYAYCQEHRDPVLLHSVNTYLGGVYREKGNFKRALIHTNENLEINTSINNVLGILDAKSEIADILVKQKKFEEAIAYIEGYIPMAKETSSITFLQVSYKWLSEIYELKGNYKEAMRYRKQFEVYNDSLINAEHLSAVGELKIRYETEKQANEILALSEQKLKDEVALQKQQTKIDRMSLGLILGILLLGGLFVIFRQHFRNKKQRELLTAITQTQTEERKRIAQDLHDSVGGSLALTKNKLEQVLNSNKERSNEILPFLESLKETGEQIRQISHNMMPGELLKFGLIPAIETLLNAAQSELLDTHLYVHGFELRLDSTKELHMYRIIQETLQNTLKHARATSFTVNINRHTGYISLILEDDGIGFSKEIKKQKGIGLQNIENRIALLGGKMKLHSEPSGKGTTFDFKIPLL